MDESKDVHLLKDLVPFSLPTFTEIQILNISSAVTEVKHFLVHSLGQQTRLELNCDGDLMDGSEWVETIVKVLPKVKKGI
jgi:hypothetical protein